MNGPAPTDTWGAMVAVLAGEPLPALPALPGRRPGERVPEGDDQRRRLLTDADVWRALARETCPLAQDRCRA